MNKDLIKILGLCIALPTTVLGIGLLVSMLIEKKLISTPIGIIIIVLVIASIFYRILKLNRSKDE